MAQPPEPRDLVAALPPAPPVDWTTRPLPELIDHIVATYHEPLATELPRLVRLAREVWAAHGSRHSERLHALLVLVLGVEADLVPHMREEEDVLFPWIRDGGPREGVPMRVIHADHRELAALLRRIRTATGDFVAPDDACDTWRALYAGLEALERSLYEHIRLEERVLLPRALAQRGA